MLVPSQWEKAGCEGAQLRVRVRSLTRGLLTLILREAQPRESKKF